MTSTSTMMTMIITKITSLPSVFANRRVTAVKSRMKVNTMAAPTTSPETSNRTESSTRKRKSEDSGATSNPSKVPRLLSPGEGSSGELNPLVSCPTSPVLGRMWRFCRQHRPELMPTLVAAVRNAQKRQEQSLSEKEVVAAVMEKLMRSWGPAGLSHVYRSSIMPTQQKTVEPPVCIDLTIDDDGDEHVEKADSKKDESKTSSESRRDGPETSSRSVEKSPDADLKPPRLPPSLEALVTAAALAVPADTDTSPSVPDELEFAIAYGVDMAHRYGYNEPSSVLWREAARTVRFMSSRDRQRIWNRLKRQKKAAAA